LSSGSNTQEVTLSAIKIVRLSQSIEVVMKLLLHRSSLELSLFVCGFGFFLLKKIRFLNFIVIALLLQKKENLNLSNMGKNLKKKIQNEGNLRCARDIF
jgi:hypothetical protein